MTTIGFIGAGHIGGTLAQLAITHGYDVVVSNSRGPETLTDLVHQLGDSARAATATEAAQAGDVVVVSIPTKNIAEVPVEPLAGKVVIDTNNYYPQRDGQIAALDDESTTVSELLQAHLPESHVVKAFNHIMFSDLASEGVPAGTPDRRRALAVAGDSQDARTAVAQLVDELGFEPVDVGPLSEGWRYQRDTEAYVRRYDADGLRAALSKAVRYRDM
ncbi:NADPH-dependent F420 reductase [Cellulomonas fengjieae]|uniref:NADPH-dependent F420 reductase n=1 Tax=Cellulomonas fengjieae TaxID=2819978 RepID=UPI001AAF8350|nr:NADPH-dependent F420 reductase [Cellulomonas fengjieae]MBO3102362.1 NADPH-dependent F420 reductase [Cellulomonas fengjieae]